LTPRQIADQNSMSILPPRHEDTKKNM
jgi:hypothetical protein